MALALEVTHQSGWELDNRRAKVMRRSTGLLRLRSLLVLDANQLPGICHIFEFVR